MEARSGSAGEPRVWAAIAALVIGVIFAAWVGGRRLIDPREIDWVMKLDWQYHFLGWHFFRSEPWQFPPGLIRSYFAPTGTAIGFTDSIPLVALLLKPFSSLLPNPLQYFGVWLVLCFGLQGCFGALLTALWTRDGRLQLLGGVLFVLVPTLLGRVGHPALASHWLLLWALWMYLREPMQPVGWRMPLAYGVIAGLIHPYLAVMGVMLIGALAVRRLLERRDPLPHRLVIAATPLIAALLGLTAGWWCAGLLSLSGADDLTSTGIDQYSMNLLGPIAPAGWSSLLPELPLASELQKFEGFQYLGAGILALTVLALALTIRARVFNWRAALPLLLVVTAAAVYSLSPRVTLGASVIIDYLTPAVSRFGMFRATGRFFWPAAYALVAVAVGVIASFMNPRAARAMLVAAIALQWVDLNGRYANLRQGTHSDEFHTWPERLKADAWHVLLPHYRSVLLYPPDQCAPPATAFQPIAVLAGTYGLSINTGHLARRDSTSILASCRQLNDDYKRGIVSDAAVYVLHPGLVQGFRSNAQRPVVCAELDGIPVCVTAGSYERWKTAAEFR
jgi:hypothetical protein